MYNLVMKDLKLGVNQLVLILPIGTGALMLIPGWLYFIVLLYFCWITIPNMFAGFRSHNDLMFTSMLPVTKKDIVKARVSVIVILEMLHMVFALIFGLINLRIYPNLTYYFFGPYLGFWGLCFVMLALFNLFFIPMYYKTAYKFSSAALVGITAAMLFAGLAQWAGIANDYLHDVFYGSGVDDTALQASILIAGIAIFVACTMIAYRIAAKRFLHVEIQ